MLLEVRRELIPIGVGSDQWEQRPLSRTVWTHDGTIPRLHRLAVPYDYAVGLLSTYIDGEKVDLDRFDAALTAIGHSRRDIERAIA
jgi:hypothetical protein